MRGKFLCNLKKKMQSFNYIKYHGESYLISGQNRQLGK